MVGDKKQSILVVEDEERLAEMYAEYLSEDYEIRTAYNAEEGFEKLDETIDIILLDRRMPKTSGNEFLKKIRKKNYRCMVAMVTAVDPGFEILEMDFDDYVLKPVTREKLQETVERMAKSKQYQEHVREFFRMASKYTTMQEHKSIADLETNREFKELEKRMEKTREKINETLLELEEEEFDSQELF